MQSTPVESSALTLVAYDEARQLLRLEFRNRAVYHYFGVPTAVHEALLEAPSKGGYFHRFIRGRFRYGQASPGRGSLPPSSSAPERQG
jgi:lysyl-tRNA synthetase class 2